jgi:copper chaperone
MRKLTFKTTLKCAGCEAAVKPNLDALEGILSWETDLKHPDKLLKVDTDLSSDTIISAVSAAGFKAELLEEA